MGQEELKPLDIKLAGPFSVNRDPYTDDICVYDRENNTVECFFGPEEAENFCAELNAEHEALKQAKQK